MPSTKQVSATLRRHRPPGVAAIDVKADSHTSEAARTGCYGGCRESTRSIPSSARLAVGSVGQRIN